MNISVIIPIYNAQLSLDACIKSLLSQTIKSEIICVDDGSTDSSQEMLKNYPQIQIYSQSHQGPALARNFGASHANGEILVFVDADMTFDQDFIENLTLPIIKGVTQGTFTTNEKVLNWSNVWARCWNYEYLNQISRYRVPQNQTTSPVFRAITRSAFNSVKGFEPGGYDDDYSLGRKLGFLAINAPKAVIYHANPESLNKIFFQASWVATRKYKFGEWGRAFALFRANPIFSVILGLYKAYFSHEFAYPVFKLVYNAGITWGIIKSWFNLSYEKN